MSNTQSENQAETSEVINYIATTSEVLAATGIDSGTQEEAVIIQYEPVTNVPVLSQGNVTMEDRAKLLADFINHPDPKFRIDPPVIHPASQLQLNAYKALTGVDFDPANPTAHDDDFSEDKVFTFPAQCELNQDEVNSLIEGVTSKDSNKQESAVVESRSSSTTLAFQSISKEQEASKVFDHVMKKKKVKKSNVQMKEMDASGLIKKFNGDKQTNKKQDQKSVLLVPANRQASSFLQKAFNGSPGSNSLEGTDGIDHINISSIANTDLGKFLDINAKSPFEHRELANFLSVGGLWYYVKGAEPDERFRYTWGDRCRMMGRNIESRNVIGFKTIIADATWMKIVASERAVDELIESTLPFKNYYYFGPLNLRKTTPEASWYTAAISEIRRTLKMRASTGNMNLMPDFFFLEEQSRFQ